MNRYVVNRPLIDSDISFINSLPDGSIIQFRNTKGQNKDLFRKIKSSIRIRVVGGLDEKEKPKFDSKKYFDRTLYSPLEIYKIIEKMESIEKNINPSWNDLEKAMYIYKTLCEGMKYDHIDVPVNGRDLCRNLLGLLTGKSVCAGFAMIYKEMMDRQGIRCLYQNRQHGHAWNLVEINGKLVPVDLTWDNTHNEYENNRCDFIYFGRDKYFFNDRNHIVTGEKVYSTSLLTDKEFNSAYNNILNNKNIETDVKQYITAYGEKVDYIVIMDGKYKRCFISKNNKLKTVLYDDTIDIKTILDNNLFMFNEDSFVFTLNPREKQNMVIRCKNTKIFKRNDGSEFFLQSDGKDPSGVINHKYISIENHKMNGYTILSDDNLTNTPPAYDQGIANILLSKNRLQEKVQKFNGYVGYIGIENGRFVKYANIPVEERISGIKRY